MENRIVIYGQTAIGLIFIPEARLKAVLKDYEALEIAKTWGELREMVSPEMFAVFQKHAGYSDATLKDDLPLNPNEVFYYESPEALMHPEIEMSEWVPKEIQEKYGQLSRYYAMDGNVPKGQILNLDEDRMVEIVAALEEHGYVCRRDDDQVDAYFQPAFDPFEFPDP